MGGQGTMRLLYSSNDHFLLVIFHLLWTVHYFVAKLKAPPLELRWVQRRSSLARQPRWCCGRRVGGRVQSDISAFARRSSAELLSCSWVFGGRHFLPRAAGGALRWWREFHANRYRRDRFDRLDGYWTDNNGYFASDWWWQLLLV